MRRLVDEVLMAREFELKLEIPAAAASKVMRLPWLWQQASGEIQPRQMAAVYYDTPKYALHERGITLRVRSVGAKQVQTVKAIGDRGRHLLDRGEWEHEIAGNKPELRHAPGTPLKAFARKKLRRNLAPVFEVKVERSAYPVQSGNSAIEVAIDRGCVSTSTSSASFCEIELELKRGASSELARLARRLASEVPASLALKTKADRGFELRSGQSPCVYRAEPINLKPRSRIGSSLQLIGWSCLRQVALNVDAVKNGDTEGVHQMRIGLRRLRALMSILKELVDGPETDAVHSELDWLTDELGPARELDVFVEKTLAPLALKTPEEVAIRALRDDIIDRRREAIERARAAVTSDRFRQVVLRTALWLLAGEWSDAPDSKGVRANARVDVFARRVLEKRTRKIIKKLRRVRELDIPERHRLRIAIKKLRYACEFFAGAFAGAKRQQSRFVENLSHLQGDLGRLNDIAVHRRLASEIVEDWTAPESSIGKRIAADQYALGYAIGQEQHEIEGCAASAFKMRKQLASSPRFWR